MVSEINVKHVLEKNNINEGRDGMKQQQHIMVKEETNQAQMGMKLVAQNSLKSRRWKAEEINGVTMYLSAIKTSVYIGIN